MDQINIGTCVKLYGEWVQSKGSKQPMELNVNKCEIVGYNENHVNIEF